MGLFSSVTSLNLKIVRNRKKICICDSTHKLALTAHKYETGKEKQKKDSTRKKSGAELKQKPED